MIGVDWGTTSFRAFRFKNGEVVERRDSAQGILQVPPGGFDEALRRELGNWLQSGETRVLMAGMIGSRQGWVEAPYLQCPAGFDDLAASLVVVPFAGAAVAVVPGLQGQDPAGVPEVMRGEETQMAGAMRQMGADAVACLPGTHSKWATLKDGRIAGFATHMTGEVFAALRGHTILGRMMQEAPTDHEAFLDGAARAREAGGLLHHLFGVRTLGLFARLPEKQASSYLSGLLIGHEIEAAAPGGTVHLIGAPSLCTLYALALEQRGVHTQTAPPDLAASGLALIAERAGWS
jgi:2-dehydro-3-deoxygalactonokinase